MKGDVLYNEHEHAGDIIATINAITKAFSMTWLPYADVTTTTSEDDSQLQIHQVHQPLYDAAIKMHV